MLSKQLILLICFVAYASCQTYTKLETSDCGSKNVVLNKLDYKPMPIVQPGSGRVTLSIAATEPINGVVQTELKIVRTVNKIKLPVSCYKVEGENFGSCIYTDLCALIKRVLKYDRSNCPNQLRDVGIDCECPINISKNNLDVEMDVDLPQAPSFANWLSVGDFDVVLKASVGKIYGCYNIKFSVKPQ